MPDEVVVTNPKPASNYKTTIAALVLVGGLVVDQLERLVNEGVPQSKGEWIAFGMKAVGAIALGLFVRDKDVNSEGQRVKIKKAV